MTKQEYISLKAQIKAADKAYYDQDDPIMGDPEYDALMRKLKAAEEEHPEWVSEDSPTQHVGGSAGKSTFAKTIHVVPMKSLQDVFDEEEVRAFLNRIKQGASLPVLSVEEKIDGLSLSATYEHGVMIRAETRGDGLIGEDVTENAKYIRGLPHRLPGTGAPDVLEVRCEVYLPIAEFERLNKENEQSGRKLFANPRNAAAGLLRTKEIGTVKNANLHAFAFNVQRCSSEEMMQSHLASMAMLDSMGFATIPRYQATTAQAVSEYINRIGKLRNALPYWIDGAVVKIDDIALRDSIGETAKYPNWAVAYKYPPEEKATVIKEIFLQTGRTGRVTPVAVFDPPLLLAGTKVERATLHNPEIIQKLGVSVGDEVLVRKAAEIIPEVIRVVKKNSREAYFHMLRCKCPSCGGSLTPGNGEDATGAYCTNADCPAQAAKKFEFWASRDCMDIRGLGPAQIDKFIELGWLKTIPDIYRLKNYRVQMEQLAGFGKKAVDNLLEAIEQSKGHDIDRLIKAIGIPGVGRHIGKALASHVSNAYCIAEYSADELQKVAGIGKVSADAICHAFDKRGKDTGDSLGWAFRLLTELDTLGVNLRSLRFADSNAAAQKPLSGKTFVITGTLPTMKREEAAALIEENGGRVSGSVSRKTDFLLCGEAAGSKLTKAQALNVPVISENDLRQMLG